MKPHFVKIGADGAELPADATGHVAVLDKTNGLMWPVEHSPKAVRFASAAALAAEVSTLGFTDWRVPTRAELLTLVDDTRYDPAIDTSFFPGARAAWYWTSSVDASDPGSYAWCVYFYYGGSGFNVQSYAGFVRAVRSVAAPAASQ